MSEYFVDTKTGLKARYARGSQDVLEQMAKPGALLTTAPYSNDAVIVYKDSKEVVIVKKRILQFLKQQGKINLSCEFYALTDG